MDKKSQNQQIAECLKKGGKITSYEALSRFGCLRLSGRIHDLRHNENMPIKSVMIDVNGKRVAQYSLVEQE